ncbi:GPP34 family phosphoprotein [Mobilicoccus sp.]|uniref:GOLPH3/VPS74 family protein n=1 Tax=Mobilicoccus sp. TaxID=2034349 RepID=UPI0028A20F84|nr:GPP34 family phosphoprotein [Mobilicoccus sp.]
MITSEELMLLLTRDDGKPESAFTQNTWGYAAANIADLVIAERITLDEAKDPRLTVIDSSPTGHPALDAALARLERKDGAKVSSLVTDGKVAAQAEIVASLQQAGVIEVEAKRFLGLVPEKRPIRDAAPERALRERLGSVLRGTTATPREATLLAIVQSLDIAPKVFAEETGGMSKKEIKARIEEVATHDHAGETVSAAVARALQAMNTAIVVATIVPIVTSTSSS